MYNIQKKKEGLKLKRIRVAGIILINGGIALMHRKDVLKNPNMSEYYTIPGGGLEEGESFEEGVKREIKEEFGIDVKPEKLLYEQESKKFNQIEKYYLCKYENGVFGTGTGPEFSGDPKYIDSGKYIPELIKKEDIEKINLVPPEIKEKIIKSFR